MGDVRIRSCWHAARGIRYAFDVFLVGIYCFGFFAVMRAYGMQYCFAGLRLHAQMVRSFVLVRGTGIHTFIDFWLIHRCVWDLVVASRNTAPMEQSRSSCNKHPHRNHGRQHAGRVRRKHAPRSPVCITLAHS